MEDKDKETWLQTIRARLEWNEKGGVHWKSDPQGLWNIVEPIPDGKLTEYFEPAYQEGFDKYSIDSARALSEEEMKMRGAAMAHLVRNVTPEGRAKYSAGLANRNTSYRDEIRRAPAEVHEYKRQLRGTRLQRFIRWFKGLWQYHHIDWVSPKVKKLLRQGRRER